MNSNPQPANTKPKNAAISAYEMHVTKFTDGSKFKSFTFRGDKTLLYYQSMNGYGQGLTGELAALLLKFQNSPRILNATIYDNTGNPIRVAIIQIENRVITKDLTGNL